ncbi:MAG: rhodanese-like domain-containing protein [Streptococcaceae bacterium]|jgi:rhodanese-related sulfurtransferase|nr:rhodanese-like domain-containing protein [Streptococcaceae bacterium]
MAFNILSLAAFEQLAISELKVIDVRPREQFESCHIPTAVNIPIDDVEEGKFALDAKQHYYVICRTTNKAYRASHIFDQAGLSIEMVAPGMINYQGDIIRNNDND